MQFCPQCATVYSDETQFCPVHGTKLEHREEFAEGLLVCGRYEIEHSLGRGAMGEVFLVSDRKLLSGNNRRALKVPLTRFLTDRTYLNQFMNEADKTLALSHPNIVRSFHVDTTESGVPFLLMEYIEGRELRYWMDREPRLMWKHVREIGIEIACALEAAHAAGVVHCDMKPESVRSASPNHPTPVKVFDFGLAKAAQVLVGANSPVGTGTVWGGEVIAGTLNYMAPEQAIARNKVGPPSDIYSLGVILFELVANKLPYPDIGSAEEARQLHLTGTPVLLDSYPGIPSALPGLIAAMMDRSPEKRPSASEVAQRLGAMQGTIAPSTAVTQVFSSQSSHTVPVQDVASSAKSKTPWIIAGAVAAVLAVAGIVYASNSKSSISSTGGGGFSAPSSSSPSSFTPSASGEGGSNEGSGSGPGAMEMGRLSIACDVSCIWFINNERQVADSVRLPVGRYEVRAVMAENENVSMTWSVNLDARGEHLSFSPKEKRSVGETGEKGSSGDNASSPRPDNTQRAEALIQQAETERKNKDYEGAFSTINSALRLDPSNTKALSVKDDIMNSCDYLGLKLCSHPHAD